MKPGRLTQLAYTALLIAIVAAVAIGASALITPQRECLDVSYSDVPEGFCVVFDPSAPNR